MVLLKSILNILMLTDLNKTPKFNFMGFLSSLIPTYHDAGHIEFDHRQGRMFLKHKTHTCLDAVFTPLQKGA